jgi:hypothetical protein
MFMNECEIDSAAERYRAHPVLGRATRLLAAYRDEVNRKSDGWPYWGSKCADKLMDLIYSSHPWASNREPTEAEVRRAIGPIKSFCTKKGLDFAAVQAAAGEALL